MEFNDSDWQRLIGALEANVTSLQKAAAQQEKFLTNHWPHMVADVAVLKSHMVWIKRLIGAGVALGGVAVIHLAFFLVPMV